VVEGSVSFDETIFLAELSQIFAVLNFFSRRLSEAESEKRAFGVCDNLPRRQDGAMAEKILDSGKDSSQKPRSRAGTSGIPFLLPPQLLNSSPKAFQGMILGIIWD
jgi:hypothetical protein